MVLHGTHPLSDQMNRVGMNHGMAKINQNRTIREHYHNFMNDNGSRTDLTKLQEQAVEEYAKGVERYMVEVFGSAGKAIVS